MVLLRQIYKAGSLTNLGLLTGHITSLWHRYWAITGGDVPAHISDELVRLQFERIGTHVPILYFAIALIAVVAASASGGGFDLLYHIILPLGFIFMGIYRSLVWYRRRSLPLDMAKARRQLQSTTMIALGMSLIGGIWTVDAYLETDEARRVLAPIFIFMIVFASAICLNSLPRAAIGLMITALIPPLVAMIMSDDIGIQAMGICLMIVSILLMGLVVSHFRDMLNNLKLRHELQHLAETDALTGLSNRRAFEARFNALRESDHEDQGKDRGQQNSFAVVMIDLNGFKRANDRFGHAAGDAILIEVAQRLEVLCKDAVCIARLGGDEFALLLPNTKNSNHHRDQLAAIRKVLSLPYQGEEENILISASVGLALCPDHGESLSRLMHHADTELYHEKHTVSMRRSA